MANTNNHDSGSRGHFPRMDTPLSHESFPNPRPAMGQHLHSPYSYREGNGDPRGVPLGVKSGSHAPRDSSGSWGFSPELLGHQRGKSDIICESPGPQGSGKAWLHGRRAGLGNLRGCPEALLHLLFWWRPGRKPSVTGAEVTPG